MGIARIAGVAAMVLACAFGAPAAAQDEALAAAEAIDTSGQPEAAEAAWREVIKLEQARPQPRLEVLVAARTQIADSLYYRGRPDLAQAIYEEAVALIEASGQSESDLMSETLSNLGVMLTGQGRPLDDIAIQRRALAIRTRMHGPDDVSLATNYFNLGNALHEAGQPIEAAENVERGARMRLATMEPTDPDLFLSLTTAAGIIEASGDVETGIELARQALTLVSTYHRGHLFSGFVRGTLGKALVSAGRAAEAVPVLQTALQELDQAMGAQHPLTLTSIANLSVAQARLGHFAEAKELMLRSRPAESETAPDMARALISASNYAAEAGEEAEALRLGEEVYRATVERLAPDSALRARAAELLAVHLERAGEIGRALTLMREAREGLGLSADPEVQRLLQYDIHLGGLEIRNGEVEAGFRRVAEAADRLVPMMFDASESPELGVLNNGYYETFARAAEAAVDAGHPDAAFRFHQLAAYNPVARASRQVALRGLAGGNPVAANQLRAMQDAQRRLRALTIERTAHVGAGRTAEAARTADAIAVIEAQIAGPRESLAQSAPQLVALTAPEPLALATLQGRLGGNEGVYVAMPSRTRTTLLLITRDDVQAATLDRARNGIRPMVAAVRDSIALALVGGDEGFARFDLTAAHALYRMLFPVELRPGSDIDRLYVAATDALAQIPFDLLVTRAPAAGTALADAAWLLRDMAVEVPVTLAAIGQDTGRTGTRAPFAGIGAPALAGPADRPIQLAGLYRDGSVDVKAVRELPPLPAAEQELARMRAALGGGEALLLTGEAATERAVKTADLSRYGVLAFATHGLLANELDGLNEPALVLTPPESANEGDDGLLSAGEIAELDLAADLVILSACNTAAGATQAAPPYTGLAQAFLYAGAKSLLLSHWRVRDDAAARLSVATAEGSASGLNEAEALRRAKLALIADASVPGGAHPAIWAPFILIGR